MNSSKRRVRAGSSGWALHSGVSQVGWSVMKVLREDPSEPEVRGQLHRLATILDLWPQLAASDPDLAVFADPARRTGAGRSWTCGAGTQTVSAAARRWRWATRCDISMRCGDFSTTDGSR